MYRKKKKNHGDNKSTGEVVPKVWCMREHFLEKKIIT